MRGKRCLLLMTQYDVVSYLPLSQWEQNANHSVIYGFVSCPFPFAFLLCVFLIYICSRAFSKRFLPFPILLTTGFHPPISPHSHTNVDVPLICHNKAQSPSSSFCEDVSFPSHYCRVSPVNDSRCMVLPWYIVRFLPAERWNH